MDQAKKAAPQVPETLCEASKRMNLGETLSRLERARKKSLEYAQWLPSQDLSPRETKAAARQQTCGTYLWLREYFETGQIRVSKANWCGKYLSCPFCAILRAKKGTRKALERFRWITGRNPELTPYMVTQTVRNGSDLEDRYTHLMKANSKLLSRRRDRIKKGRGLSALAVVSGGLGSVEVKRGSGSGEWHPHIHNVWLTEQEIDPGELRWEWQRITGDSNQIDVRPLRGTDDVELIKSFCEVFKYALKFSSLTFEDRLHASRLLYGRRMLITWGCFRGIADASKGADDYDDMQGELFMEYFYEWMYNHSTYNLLRVEDQDGRRLKDGRPSDDNYQRVLKAYGGRSLDRLRNTRNTYSPSEVPA